MSWYYNMKIGSKLIAAFLIVGAITAAVGYMGIRSMGEIAELSASSYANETLGITYLKQANVVLIEADRAEKNVLLSNTSEERELFKGRLEGFAKDLNENLDKARPLIHTDKGKELLTKFDQAWKEHYEVANQVIALATKERLQQNRASVELSRGLGRQKSDAVEAVLAQLVAVKEDNAKEAVQTADQTYRNSRTLMLILVLGGVLSGLGLGLFISRSISKPLARLAEAAKNISLGDVKQEVDYRSRDEVGSLADSFRDLVAYIRGVSEALEKVAVGDMSSKIEAKSDRDVLTKSYQRTADAVKELAADAAVLAQAAADGKLAVRADAAKHRGDYRKLIEGINMTLDNVIKPLNVSAEYVDRISKGDIPPRITDSYNGDFNEIKNNLNVCIDSIRALVDDTGLLVKAAAEGKLATRADTSKHQGDFRKIVEGVNSTLDAVIGPLNVSAEYVDRISKGDIPPKITDSYNGDFNEIKNNLNNCIENINALVNDSGLLVKAAVDGKLATRADASKHQGDYRKIVEGVNSTLDAV